MKIAPFFCCRLYQFAAAVKPDLRDGGPFHFFSLLRKRPASGRVTAERRYYNCNWKPCYW